jgi:serine phosphatase RsbU (regulator of sigma subunit)
MITAADILNAKILIVDDKGANVDLLRAMLGGAGYTSVQWTMDPLKVSSLHREHRYDLILLDLLMPVLDGFQVMEGLKEIEADSYLPVLVLTAQPDHKLRALKAGAKDFLSKPFELPELLARVHNLLEVRLLHLDTKKQRAVLEEVVRQLDASRELVFLKTSQEKKQREKELTLAQDTQRSLLPKVLPRFENFHIHAFNSATGYVGGDFYDFRQLASREWMGVLADVSGKGVPAALYSSLVLGALSMEFRSRTQPHEVLNRVNELLCEKSLPSQFVTLFLFVLNPDGNGQFVSAGHTPTFIFRSASSEIEELASDAYMLGMFPFHVYKSRKLHLDPGDILVAYTDGLPNAENPERETFGVERLREVIQQEAPLGSHAVERGLLKAIEDFTRGVPQPDDITFVVVGKDR